MTAVLSLALAGAAHALSVDLVLPETDPAEVYPQVRVRFLAVAWDEQGNDVSDRATFTWTFPDAKEPTVGNPVLHRFPELGKFLVAVTATLDSDSGCDQTTVIVIPYEGGGLRQVPGVDDFTFTARCGEHVFGAEVCDEVELVVEQVGDTYPFFWVGTEFQRYQNGQWVILPSQWGPVYEWFTILEAPHNGPVQWRARVMLDDIGADPPNGMDLYLPGTWTVVNTVVKATGDPLILHHAEDTAHTIGWTITHCDDLDPVFAVTVTICDLAGNTVATLTVPDAGVGAGSVVWNTNLPEENGIYTYKIQAQHPDPALPHPCVDQDKSATLTISNVSVTDFTWSQTRYPDYAFVVLNYTLSRAASGVEVQCYKRDLALTTIDDPETFPCTASTHNVLVEFAVDREVMGPYRFVISADETATDGANNRDGDPKPALQKGATQVIWPPATGLLGGDLGQSPHTLAEVVAKMGATDVDGTCYAASSDTSHTAYAAREALRKSAVLLLYAHSNPTKMSFDNSSGSGVHDLLGDTGTDCPGDDNYYVANIPEDLNHVLFALCAGCECAGCGSWSTGSVPAAIVAKGAKSAIGFVEEIVVGQTWTFVHEFFDVLLNPLMTVDDAAYLGAEEAYWEHSQDYGGTDSWVRGGSNVTVRPARFGQ